MDRWMVLIAHRRGAWWCGHVRTVCGAAKVSETASAALARSKQAAPASCQAIGRYVTPQACRALADEHSLPSSQRVDPRVDPRVAGKSSCPGLQGWFPKLQNWLPGPGLSFSPPGGSDDMRGVSAVVCKPSILRQGVLARYLPSLSTHMLTPHSRDVRRLGVVLAHALLLVPGVPLGAARKVQDAGLGCGG
eukprot:358866-Chlamydomonas_euryale.AAC.3